VNHSTVINHRDNLIVRVRDIFRTAERRHSTHADIVGSLSAVWSDADKLPRYASSYIDGYIRAKFDHLDAKMTFGAWHENSFYDTQNRDSPCYIDNRGISWEQFSAIACNPESLIGLFWRDDVTKPYSVRQGS
jgi:hypothetical protein